MLSEGHKTVDTRHKMAESNGVLVRGIPPKTRKEDLWKAFDVCCNASCSIEYILFPLSYCSDRAYVHFTAYPGHYSLNLLDWLISF